MLVKTDVRGFDHLASNPMKLRTAPGDGPLATIIEDEEANVSKEDRMLPRLICD